MAGELDVLLAHADGFATGDAQLLSDQIHTRHHLSHRMLHLDPGVHLHEVEATAAIQQEFHRSGALVIDASGGSNGGFAHAAAQVGIQGRAGGLLQQFLVTALNRAVPFTQVNHVAVAVGQHLHFHVAGPIDEFLHVEAGVAEGGFRLPLGRFVQALQLAGVRHEAHAATTAAGGGLDHHGIAHFLGQGGRLAGAAEQTLAAGHRGNTHRLHGRFGGRLVPHRANRVGGRPNEGEAVITAHLGELVVLRQEAVAGVDGVSTAGGGGRQDVGNVEVALAAQGFAHADRFIGELHVQSVLINGAVHRHGGDAELAAASNDPEGNLAAVGDQHFADGHPAACSGLTPDRISADRSCRGAKTPPGMI